MHKNVTRSLTASMLLVFATGSVIGAPATPQASSKTTTASKTAPPASGAKLSEGQLDQMMAPVALYPDSLLAQVLMASTYPGDVVDAIAWSKAHPDDKGEEAVAKVANEPWDPSVQSLVAFPQLLAVFGQDPDWIQRMGDAFLADSEAVMDSVQRLRRQAEAAGNLKSNEQQKVSHESAETAASTTTTAAPAPQTIIIESADPEVVYVPSYNSSMIYGTWGYPMYPPYYYPPPGYYYPGGALISFGIGVAIGGALWGNCNWGGGDIDIDVNRNTNFNGDRNVNRNGQGNRGDKSTWQHNAANRDGVPYRDNASREKFGQQKRDGAASRDSYRGRDNARNAASDSLQKRGMEAPATSNREARDRASSSQRQMNQGSAGVGRPPGSLGQGTTAQNRAGTGVGGANRNAFSGASNPALSRGDANRGHQSYQRSQRPASSRPQSRPASRPAAPRRSGGGGGGRRR